MRQRLERAERLLRGGVPKTASDEAERIATESQDPSIVVRALRVVADGARPPGSGDLAGHVFLIIGQNANPGYQAGKDHVVELVNPTHLGGLDPTDFIISH